MMEMVITRKNSSSDLELEHTRCIQVLNQIKKRELDVLHAFAAGMCRTEVAEKLCLTPHAVDNYKWYLLALCRQAWNMPSSTSLTHLFLYRHFGEAIRQPLSTEERVRCQQVILRATKRQREVLFALAHGLTPKEVAKQLNITRKAVNQHNAALLEICRDVWNVHVSNYRYIYVIFVRYMVQNEADLIELSM